jgi:hypothetical protein
VNTGNYGKYRDTKQNYINFAKSLLERVATL